MGRCGALGLFLVVSGCAAVSGLSDYEVVDDAAGAPDGGDAIAEAGFTPDRADSPGPDASLSDGDASDAGSELPPGLCARTDCGSEPAASCSAEPCGNNLVWQRSGPGAGTLTSGGTCRIRNGGALSTQHDITTRFAFGFGFALTVQDIESNTPLVIAELVSNGDPLFQITASRQGQVRLCTSEGTCTPARTIALHAPLETADVFGSYENGAWRVGFTVGSDVCTGDMLTVTKSVSAKLIARVGTGSKSNDAEVDLIVDNLVFSVSPR